MARDGCFTIPGPGGRGSIEYEIGHQHGLEGRRAFVRTSQTYMNGWADGYQARRVKTHDGVICVDLVLIGWTEGDELDGGMAHYAAPSFGDLRTVFRDPMTLGPNQIVRPLRNEMTLTRV